ncbi:MAG: flagellar hook capping protein [Nitratiruptor sp.]|nr:flagellar hook capping protein [Nitratiruptor sp.]NPA84271.1 flagellar hook capping protein [Campylobacterota bacterium]
MADGMSIEGVGGKTIPVYDANYDNSQMDQEGFLKVLLTSFQYQDPFETQDISKFIDNTVKLRELEIMNTFEESVKSLNSSDTLFLSAANLIGKKLLYEGRSTYVEGGKSHIQFTPLRESPEATLYIYDSEGRVVAQRSFSNLEANQRYTFDLDDASLEDGYYKVSVVAQNGGEEVEVKLYVTGRADGIQKDGSEIVVLVDDGKVPLGNIVKIGG